MSICYLTSVPDLLTIKMKEILNDCLEREFKALEPSREKIIKIAEQLIIRGLVEIRTFQYIDGRKAAYFITEKGKEILRKCNG